MLEGTLEIDELTIRRTINHLRQASEKVENNALKTFLRCDAETLEGYLPEKIAEEKAKSDT